MITIRPSAERGHVDHGWLDTRHTFSFAGYHDPRHMGFGVLRVINQDRVQPGQGFGTHGHRDMEVLSYVVSGALEHRDSMGHGSIIRPGEVQLMSAGTGVTHSEFNPSREETTEFLQIWILPRQTGTAPRYEQREFSLEGLDGELRLLTSPDGREGSLRIGQDATVSTGRLAAGESLPLRLSEGRSGWVQVIRGRLDLNGIALAAGDGAALVDEPSLLFQAMEDAEILVFDLPEVPHE